jgi:transitional endoplasmic reticulum ATPase
MEMLRSASVLAKQGIAVPRSILLQGPPGTGKTEIARVIASEAGMSFKAYSTAQLKGQYLGQTAANVKKVFETARASSPAIVYLDEIDIVAGSRGGGRDDRFTDEFLGQILQEMDGITHHEESVFVIASTNSPQTLDDALKSRFEETITVDLPDESARLAILNVRLKGKPLADNVISSLREIAARSSEWSGRDMKNLVASAERGATSRARKEGKMDAVQITAEDLMASFEKMLAGSKQ